MAVDEEVPTPYQGKVQQAADLCPEQAIALS